MTLVFIALAGLVFWNRTAPPDRGAVSCPIYFSGDLKAIPPGHVASRWQIYRFEGEQGTADVAAGPSTVSTHERPYSCALDIARAPTAPGKGADWRIGHAVKPDGLRGKTVRLRVAIKANRDLQFDTGQVYAYDGVQVAGTSAQRIAKNWQTFEATIKVDPAATTFEVWLRLLLDKGTVNPGQGKLYFVPEVDIGG